MGRTLADLPAWPAALTRDETLAYTRIAEGQLRAWERAGKVRFSPRGPNGSKIALREDIDAALRETLTGGGEDFNFA